MLATLLFGQVVAQGAQFFQPQVPGSFSRTSAVSQSVPVPIMPQNAPVQMVPLTGDELSLQLVRLGQDDREENMAEPSVPYLTVAVCALAVAGVTAQLTRSERSRAVARIPEPVMQMQQIAPTTAGTVAPSGGRGAPVGVADPILVQGGSLRTWSYRSPAVEQVQVVLGTEGRPLDADIELWHGPDNTPVKMRVYCENGQIRPFSAVIETPRGPNTVAIRNIGQIEFPIAANVIADDVDMPSQDAHSMATTVQGGALRTYPFDPTVDSVEVLIRTDGRPLNARIELLQGPNNNKQVIELYTEDGCDRPFFCILETPGAGNVIRIVNTSPVEFPMTAGVVPHSINQEMASGAVLGGDVVIGGDVGW
jgi:hypothetical protein